CVGIIVLGLYGLKNSVTGAYGYTQTRAGYYDPMTGISQDMVSPAVLQYLRAETRRNNFKRPLVLVDSPAAILSLPGFRILYPFGNWTGYIDGTKWVGRVPKIFVVLPEKWVSNVRASKATLRLLTSYEFDNWKYTKLDGMIIYTQ